MNQKIGQRQTQQREIIFKVIQDASGPLTTQEIHLRACKISPTLGIATVYRAIKLLLDSKIICSVTLPDGQTRYEAAQMDHHHHFHCRLCEESYCFFECPIGAPKASSLPEGFQVENHDLTLHGLCPKCTQS